MESISNLKMVLMSNGIQLVDKKKIYNKKEYDIKMLKNHIDNLVYFHNIFNNSINLYTLGLSSNIWKDIENFKVWNRRCKRVLEILNCMECEIIVKRAEYCIESIYKLPYIKMITRSMENKEVCVGKPYETNIWNDFNLKIIDISKINFNMKEIDCYKFLGRLKRKGENLEWNSIISYFLEHEYLNDYSKNYIMALLSYPYETMRYIQKLYFMNIYNRDEVVEKILELISIDGNSLI